MNGPLRGQKAWKCANVIYEWSQSKLEATVANYESKVDEVKRKEDKISNLEEELTIKENEQKKKKRYVIE